MHRDYSIHTEGAPIRIVMYSDRLEIINEGGLYGRITLDSLGKIHADTRNQTLTHILEVQKTAENRYSGIPTIRYELKQAGLPNPKFETRRGSFIVTFENNISLRNIDNKSNIEIIENQNNLIEFCMTPRTRGEIAEFLGKTQYYAINKIVMPLVKSGKLKMTILDKPKSRKQKFYSNLK